MSVAWATFHDVPALRTFIITHPLSLLPPGGRRSRGGGIRLVEGGRGEVILFIDERRRGLPLHLVHTPIGKDTNIERFLAAKKLLIPKNYGFSTLGHS